MGPVEGVGEAEVEAEGVFHALSIRLARIRLQSYNNASEEVKPDEHPKRRA